ncbi:hypothetical protein [Mucilaginibacter sp.]|uniref:hypothetical protein n=1 Tax=Mucilaginibacter sp. TaxID=1882438 RepID=UPI003B003C25
MLIEELLSRVVKKPGIYSVFAQNYFVGDKNNLPLKTVHLADVLAGGWGNV